MITEQGSNPDEQGLREGEGEGCYSGATCYGENRRPIGEMEKVRKIDRV